MSNTATATNIGAAAEGFATWIANTIENKIAEGRALGLSDDEIVTGTRSALLTFLASK